MTTILDGLRTGAWRLVPVDGAKWQWRSRLKGGSWDAWEQGRFGQEVPPFAEIEERIICPASPDATAALLAEIEGLRGALEHAHAECASLREYACGLMNTIRAYEEDDNR